MSSNNSEPFVPKLVKMCAQAGLPSTKKSVKKVAGKTAAEMAKDAKDPKKKTRMRAAFLKSKIWPANTTVKIGFLRDPDPELPRTDVDIMEKTVDSEGNSLKVDPLQRAVANLPIKDAIIKTIMERLQPIINIKLMFYDENNELINPNVADIRIDFDDMGGAWSLLGTECLTVKDKKESTMNFGWFDVPTTLHEFCHALGMIHEHQNPKGKTIMWDKERVRTWAKDTQGWDQQTTDSNIIERYKLDEINGSTFDSKSIMLYFFPGNLVLDPNTNKCCGTGTNQNLMFSPYDVLYLNYNYPLKNSDLTSEQFTVKYFNDIFNQQVDIDDLKKQIESTKAEESGQGGSSSSSSLSNKGLKKNNALRQPGDTASAGAGAASPSAEGATETTTPPAPLQAMKPTVARTTKPASLGGGGDDSGVELCKPGCIMGYSSDQMIMISVMLFIVILLCIIIVVAILKCNNK